MQYTQNLGALMGRIVRGRVGLDNSLARDFLNERMRAAIDSRPIWSGLFRQAVVSIPEIYTTGTITVNTGSPNVIGVDTAWPVNDVVDTVLTQTLRAGQHWLEPASDAAFASVTLDTVLYVDAAGPTPEICPVLDMLQGRILVNFRYQHQTGATMTAGSLNGLQLRVSGYTSPIFTVISVTSPTTLVMDNSWGAGAMTGSSYQILKIYTTIDPMLKGILLATDPFQQIELRVHVSQKEVNLYDPNRTATNSPTSICDRGPNINGNMTYEIYPPQTTPYQLNVLYHVQWPDMRVPTDFPPPFFNPNLLIHGAMAQAFGTYIPRPPDGKDPGFNLDAARYNEELYQQDLAELINADESKYQTMFTWNIAQTFGSFSMGSQWLQSHDYDSASGNY